MKFKTKRALLLAVPVLIIAGVVFYLRRNSGGSITPAPLPPSPTPTPTPTPVTPTPTGFSNYIVTTVNDPLNIRSGPSTSYSIIGQLAKGSTVSLKSSGTAGWMQTTSGGYVSADYVRAV